MCGIFGVIGKDKSININSLIRIGTQLKHRGPDDEGYLLFDSNKTSPLKGVDSPLNINLPVIDQNQGTYTSALVHRRLSIIDLSVTGHQPMSYNNDNLWIVFNGEIYNYIEIRESLLRTGYKFHSDSDSEVVLAAYQEWGEKGVERFNGMWAFAIYDKKKQSVFFSRDRLGVKPLYYSLADNQFIFCSEIKGIRTYLDNATTLNDNKIREYLIRGQIMIGDNKETIFNNILQLMPGHNLTLSIEKLTFETEPYWDLKIKSHGNHDSTYYIDQFRELFRDSIKLRLRSDVEVGSCLSGGLDSSSIVCYASNEFNKTFHTFSAVWPGYEFDESKYMEAVNEKAGSLKHFVTYNMDDFLTLHDELMWHQEIPLAGSSLIAQWFVMKEAKRNNIKVLLDGQGADEILGGYPGYIQTYVSELFGSFQWDEFFRNRCEWSKVGYTYKMILLTILNRQKKVIQSLINPLRKYNHSWFPVRNKEINNYFPKNRFQGGLDSGSLAELLKEHIVNSNLPALLHFEDRNSMAHSVEARVPFLDYRLVEYAVNIPSKFKFRGGMSKVILREAMKSYLPDQVYFRRDKIGFSTPIEQRISNDKKLSGYMMDYLTNSELYQYDWIDKSRFDQKTHLFGLYSLARFIDKNS
jgi:asparagine synthase (glutamine-hydrolysing)